MLEKLRVQGIKTLLRGKDALPCVCLLSFTSSSFQLLGLSFSPSLITTLKWCLHKGNVARVRRVLIDFQHTLILSQNP